MIPWSDRGHNYANFIQIPIQAKVLAYLREVEERGEELIITDHGRPVVKIVPLPRPSGKSKTAGNNGPPKAALTMIRGGRWLGRSGVAAEAPVVDDSLMIHLCVFGGPL